MKSGHSGGIRWATVAASVLAIGCASWGVMNQVRLQRLAQESEAGETRFAMMQLQRELQVPSEALYFDPGMSIELAALRMKGYQKYGVTGVLPYMNLVSANGGMSFGGSKREFPVVDDRESRLTDLANASPESYWLNHLNRPCQSLASEIGNGSGLGGYLKQHPEEFDRHIRPLVIRLLDAYHPWIICNASQVLLAMGDRSDQLMEIISILAHLEIYDERARRMAEEYGLDLKPAEGIPPDQDLLLARNPQWKRVHSLVSELKAKYPVVEGTIIGDLRR